MLSSAPVGTSFAWLAKLVSRRPASPTYQIHSGPPSDGMSPAREDTRCFDFRHMAGSASVRASVSLPAAYERRMLVRLTLSNLKFSNRRSTRISGIALVLIEIEPSVLLARSTLWTAPATARHEPSSPGVTIGPNW